MAKVIMVQGTMSNVGKSLIAAGLCRVFYEDGYRVAPFKSQNMALNSFVTSDGKEMGRAQVMQAEAAGIEPDVSMNPILLKPTGNMTSQVIVNGEVVGDMGAREYFSKKSEYIPDILSAFKKLCAKNDIIVIEGAGSPAEINLKENDIVNMGLAKLVGAPVILVGDIDRGGVFAQLIGTLELLEADERELVAGLVVNKFRGDKSILDPGLVMLKERAKRPVVGCVPYFENNLEGEDSLSILNGDRKKRGEVDICILRLPWISNFTDFNAFKQIDSVSLRFITNPNEAKGCDMLIIPGSKNTIEDLNWVRMRGFDKIINGIKTTTPVFGICGGLQILGKTIKETSISCDNESNKTANGLGLLDIDTKFLPDKKRKQVSGNINRVDGLLKELAGKEFFGYEIHMGRTVGNNDDTGNPVIINNGNVYGTYVHGIFDKGEVLSSIINALRKNKGLKPIDKEPKDYVYIKEKEYERLGQIIRDNLDMDGIYRILREAKVSV